MPTYEYQCDQCESVFDVFQSIKASPLRKAFCESCGEKQPVRRLIGSGGAVIFKGSGFYQTDYRSEKYKNAAKADSDKKAGPEKDKKKSESKSTESTAKTEPAKKAPKPQPDKKG